MTGLITFLQNYGGLLGSLAVAVVVLWSLRNHNKQTESKAGTAFIALQAEAARLQQEHARAAAELSGTQSKVGELATELKTEQQAKSQLEGRGKAAFAEQTALRKDNELLQQQLTVATRELTEMRAQQAQQVKEQARLVQQLTAARDKFEAQEKRVVERDEQSLVDAAAEQTRLWNDFENTTLAEMRAICAKPEIALPSFDNTTLPAVFDGSLKPDFIVEFLGQYIIFDAKKSKARLSDYLEVQVKSTAKKIKDKDYIYKGALFFVVPPAELEGLRKRSWVDSGVHFFAVSSAAVEPLLANFKKIAAYETLSEWSPEEREALVQLLAEYDQHISFQNAANLVLAQRSIDLMANKSKLPSEVTEQVGVRKQALRQLKVDGEVRKLASNADKQTAQITAMMTPAVAVDKGDVVAAKGLFE